MALRPPLGGPTILDLNTGYLRDSETLMNLFSGNVPAVYVEEDFIFYESVINRLKKQVEATFGVSNIYFTAPTFVTRLDGNSSWKPKSM